MGIVYQLPSAYCWQFYILLVHMELLPLVLQNGLRGEDIRFP